MLAAPAFDTLLIRAGLGSLLVLVALVVAATGKPALASPTGPSGMVEKPCLELPTPPAELAARTELDLKPETPDPAALARPPSAATLEFFTALDAQRKQDWAGLCRYQAENAALPRDAHIRVVFMGDSITENWLAADPAFFSGGIVNRGIGGQTSPQMLLRFYADVIALHPRVVHIMAGTNDLAGNTGPTSPQQYKNNIMAMCDLAGVNGIRVVLAGIPPTVLFPWRAELRPGPLVIALNTWMKHYAAQRKMVYVDYAAVLADASGAMRADLSHDGVHPHRSGYHRMKPLTERAIATALRQ